MCKKFDNVHVCIWVAYYIIYLVHMWVMWWYIVCLVCMWVAWYIVFLGNHWKLQSNLMRVMNKMWVCLLFIPIKTLCVDVLDVIDTVAVHPVVIRSTPRGCCSPQCIDQDGCNCDSGTPRWCWRMTWCHVTVKCSDLLSRMHSFWTY